MIVKLCQMTNKHFSPLMIVLVLVGVLANFVQFRQNESLKADLQARTTQNQLIQADNRNLANQLENSQIQLEAYQKQVDDLNQKVLAKMKQAEQRSNEILNELEKHKSGLILPCLLALASCSTNESVRYHTSNRTR